MRLIVCSVFDSAAQAFGNPFYMTSAGVAVRSFRDEVNRDADDNQMFKHPSDFTLFELGSFDSESAEFSLHDRPEQIARGQDMKMVQS